MLNLQLSCLVFLNYSGLLPVTRIIFLVTQLSARALGMWCTIQCLSTFFLICTKLHIQLSASRSINQHVEDPHDVYSCHAGVAQISSNLLITFTANQQILKNILTRLIESTSFACPDGHKVISSINCLSEKHLVFVLIGIQSNLMP